MEYFAAQPLHSQNLSRESGRSETPASVEVEEMHRITVELALDITGEGAAGLIHLGIARVQIDVTETQHEVVAFLILGAYAYADLPVEREVDGAVRVYNSMNITPGAQTEPLGGCPAR